MTTMTATEARKQLYCLLDEVADSHEPIQIAGKRHSAVLVSEDDWNAVQETLYLTSIPGMRDSIRKGLKTPRLVGDLAGACSRRINIQQRLVYQVLDDIKTVKIIRMWSHYE